MSLTRSDDQSAGNQSAGRERRRRPRFKVAVEVELQLEADATPLRVKTAYMSTGGCYITMLFTLEVGNQSELGPLPR